MYYLCHRKEERTLDTRVLSSFFVKNLTYKGGFTSDVEKNRSEIFFFLGLIFFFLGQVMAFSADVEPQKVKTYLFLQGADLTFRGSTPVKVVRIFHVILLCARGCLQVSLQTLKLGPFDRAPAE